MNLIQRYQPDVLWLNEIDRFLERGFKNTNGFRNVREAFEESDGAWVLRLELPGFAKEDVALSVIDGTLTLKAETPPDRPFGGKFERRWKLGESVAADGISARLENGVLEVRLTKKTPVVPEPVAINIQ
jgi:HSP20 family molecular chaperone IbpA